VSNYKKWSVLLTAMTAALTSAQSTFHIRENIEAFVKTAGNLELLQAKYLAKRAEIKDDGSHSQILKLQSDSMQEYVDIMTARMRAYGNAGQLVVSPPPPPK
jgi:hypothetical protein